MIDCTHAIGKAKAIILLFELVEREKEICIARVRDNCFNGIWEGKSASIFSIFFWRFASYDL